MIQQFTKICWSFHAFAW